MSSQRKFLSRSCFFSHTIFLILISCKLCSGNNDRIDYCQWCKVFCKFSFSQRVLMIWEKDSITPRDLATQCYVKKDFLSVKCTDGVVDKSVLVVIWSRTHFIRIILSRMAVRWFNISFLIVVIRSRIHFIRVILSRVAVRWFNISPFTWWTSSYSGIGLTASNWRAKIAR